MPMRKRVKPGAEVRQQAGHPVVAAGAAGHGDLAAAELDREIVIDRHDAGDGDLVETRDRLDGPAASFMKVRGFTSRTVRPRQRPAGDLGLLRPGFCQARPSARASASTTAKPALWRGGHIFAAGMPKPATSEMDMTLKNKHPGRRGQATGRGGKAYFLAGAAALATPAAGAPGLAAPAAGAPGLAAPAVALASPAAGRRPRRLRRQGRRLRGARRGGGTLGGRGGGGNLLHDLGHGLDAGDHGLGLDVAVFDAGNRLELGDLDGLAHLELVTSTGMRAGRSFGRQRMRRRWAAISRTPLWFFTPNDSPTVCTGTSISNFSSALTSWRSTWR